VLIAEVTRMQDGPAAGAPITRIIEAYWWTGRPLHEQCDRLITLLKETWQCAKVVVDASGLSAGLATRLQKALGERVIEPFVFTSPSKSDLAYALLAHTASGRLTMWAETAATSATSPESSEFWREVERARPLIRAGQKLSFYVPEHYGHDDFLVALALTSRAARAAATITPFVPGVWTAPPPRPDWDSMDSWDPEFWERERRYGLYGTPTDYPLTPSPTYPTSSTYPTYSTAPPPMAFPPPSSDVDDTPPIYTIHSVSASPSESLYNREQGDALYVRLRRSVGLDE